MDKLKLLDIFSGIGGMSLGLERAGMNTVLFCEQDDNCKKVLKHHWPKVQIIDDVCKLNNPIDSVLVNMGIDVIAGGYPCTGHSVAGKKKGFDDDGSKLWKEYYRLIKELMPKYCIIENSANLRGSGLAEMLKDINEICYNAEWSVISAYSVGAPHQRERLYIVLWREDIPYCNPFRWWQADTQKEKASSRWWASRLIKRSSLFKQASKIESRVLQFDDGVSKDILNKNKIMIEMLGNSLVPQIPELIGRQIVENENRRYSN